MCPNKGFTAITRRFLSTFVARPGACELVTGQTVGGLAGRDVVGLSLVDVTNKTALEVDTTCLAVVDDRVVFCTGVRGTVTVNLIVFIGFKSVVVCTISSVVIGKPTVVCSTGAAVDDGCCVVGGCVVSSCVVGCCVVGVRGSTDVVS